MMQPAPPIAATDGIGYLYLIARHPGVLRTSFGGAGTDFAVRRVNEADDVATSPRIHHA